MLVNGGRIGFYQGDAKKLLDDIKVLRPTLFPCVPRVMNKIYDKVSRVWSGRGGGRGVKNVEGLIFQTIHSNLIWQTVFVYSEQMYLSTFGHQ